MFEEKKQSIIIVCDEEGKQYANLLSSLISSNDDEGDRIVGTQDGTLTAAVWTDKHFADNEPTLTSNTIIIFLGKTKSSKDHIDNISEKFNKCGIVYGWLGKKAVIYVENRHLKPEEIEELNSLGNELKQDIETKAIHAEKKGNIIARMPTWAKISIGVIGTVATGGLLTTALGVGMATYGLTAGSKDKKEQFKIQNNIAIVQFYLNSLNDFIGE